ncbi:serine/threonine-protein kinase [Phyllobacterium sp. CCNWLW109]|uniref:serine/threonine-protein kinase n=1 Tax=Phyllobacterium sp. CCNWLW109 TaxID=3127479 RepID=UPI0030774793
MTIHSPQDLIGNRYEIIEYISEGGMQEVYAATDTLLSRTVALKTPKTNSARKRFHRSAATSASINHSNVAKTLDYIEENGRYYLIEELIEGLDLGQALRDHLHRLDPYLCAHVLHHLAKGLAASHHANVVHRDLKPSNIMIAGGMSFHGVKITDFGIAKMAEVELAVVDGGDEEALTQSATALGALPYMAPEMIDSFTNATRSADVWSIGALAFELLTGTKPFGTGYRAVPAIQAAITPPLPPELLSKPQFAELTRNIYAIIQQCLLKDPTARPTADQLIRLCEDLCYSVKERRIGVVGHMPYQTNGFIGSSGGQDVFFHNDSVPVGRVSSGDRVWFSTFPGVPRERAFPVVPLKTVRPPRRPSN